MSTSPKLTGIEVAPYVLSKIGRMSHLKLQKLLYYIDAWHLAFFEEPLFSEPFEAWLHGPVLRSVWNEYKGTSILNDDILPQDGYDPGKFEEKMTPDQVEMISDVLAEYGDKNPYHLECLTHSEKPWLEARQGVPDGEASSNPICKDTTRRFYQARLA